MDWEFISELNIFMIEHIRTALNLADKPTALASDFKLSDDPTGRLIDICRALGADTYLAGAGGHDYMDLELFKKAGIKVIFQEYKHPEYAQGGKTFVPYLSALDLLFHCGPQKARSYFTQ